MQIDADSFRERLEIVEGEKTYSVELMAYDKGNKIKTIIEVIRSTGKGLAEINEFIKSIGKGPQIIKEGLTQEEAEEIRKKFEAIGAKVEVKVKPERQMEFESAYGGIIEVSDALEKY